MSSIALSPLVLVVVVAAATLLLAAAAARRRSDLGRPVEEVVATYRRAALRDSRRFAPGLAMGLHNLAVVRAEQGRPLQALEAAMEAVDLYRVLAREEPARWAKPLDDCLLLEETLSTALGFDKGIPIEEAYAQASADNEARLARRSRRARIAIWGWSLAFWIWAFSAAAILWAGL